MYDISKYIFKNCNNPPIKPLVSGYTIKNFKYPMENKYVLHESIKKSIQKIEDKYKVPNNKLKLVVTNAINKQFSTLLKHSYSDDSDDDANDNNDNNDNNFLKIIVGTTTVSRSFYLVYSFMKRYRT